jgi:hypothetical protein
VGSGGGASGGGASASAAGFELSQTAVHRDDGATADDAALFPTGAVDVNGQQIDLRTKTSWLLKLDEVETPEVCEVLAVNTVAPFILNSRLKPLLLKSVHQDRCVGMISPVFADASRCLFLLVQAPASDVMTHSAVLRLVVWLVGRLLGCGHGPVITFVFYFVVRLRPLW